MPRKNIYQSFGIPETVGIVVFTFSLVLTLAPYFPNTDFGIFKVPAFPSNISIKLQLLGPILLILSIVFYIPIFAGNKPKELRNQPQPKEPITPSEIRKRYNERRFIERAIRLIPKTDFDENGFLGKRERKYVFVGDYDEQRYRTLQEILDNLWLGNRFDPEPNSNVQWVAIVFPIGLSGDHKYDLMPGTWKAVFRILSDPSRLGYFTADNDEIAQMGPRQPRKRDYILGDQNYWFKRITSKFESSNRMDALLLEYFGISDTCFHGTGITDDIINYVPSRIFLVKNVQLSYLDYEIQDMGFLRDKKILW